MSRPLRLRFVSLGLLLAAAGLAGCLPAAQRAQLGHSVRKDWDRLTTTDWGLLGRRATGLDTIPLTAAQRAEADRRAVCRDAAERRQITQNGINDAVDYDRCPGSRETHPLGPPLGQRLAPRDM